MACFHDAPSPDLTIATTGEPSKPGLEIVQRHSGGSYVSLACDLPSGALSLMGKGRLFEVALRLTVSQERAAYLRLNLRNGPNLAQPVLALDTAAAAPHAAFDLAHVECRLPAGQGWVELIFESTAPGEIAIPDLLFWISPRAGI